jgi:hypothetical protein
MKTDSSWPTIRRIAITIATLIALAQLNNIAKSLQWIERTMQQRGF